MGWADHHGGAGAERRVRIAVTGTSGFIGGHVLRALAGSDVVSVGRSEPRGLPPGARHYALDLADATLADYDRMGRPDMLVHLAWDGLPNYLSLHHFETELPIQYRFLRNMVEAGLPAMLVTGTCYEYGMADGQLDELRDPQPANPYAWAKVALLRQLGFLQEERPFALTWARLFYIWGEGQAPTSIYPLLRAAAAQGDATFPMSAGEQLRDYLPVEDVARILAAFAMAGGNHGVVNVSSGEPVSIRALVERWIAQEGLAIRPELGRYPYPAYEPLAFWGSATKRRTLLRSLSPARNTPQETFHA